MSNPRPLKTKLSITIDSDIEEAIRELSEQDDRSVSQYINRVLRKHLISLGKLPDKAKKQTGGD